MLIDDAARIRSLEPDRAGMRRLTDAVLERACAFVEGLPEAPASDVGTPGASDGVDALLEAPAEEAGDLAALLGRVEQAAARGVETAGPGHLGWIPGGGIFAAAVADLYADVLNRYVALASIAPGLAALEYGVVRWLCDLCGLPLGATGVLTSGGSLANLSAVVSARHARLGDEFGSGTMYVTSHAHQSLAKAARLAGIRAENVRVVPCTSDLRMDPDAAERLIRADRLRGARPFLLVGSAGTTDTGAIDPLLELAGLAGREEMWFHVDAAYGGMFRLTGRGAQRLDGMHSADSITLDPHKSLFMPYGTGALVVRDGGALRAAHSVDGNYLQDLSGDRQVPDFAALGPELTRECRGLRLWLPVHLYGVGAFRAALDEKLDLAETAYDRLSSEPSLDLPWRPELTVVPFRLARPQGDKADAANRQLLEHINATRRIFLSSTTIGHRFTLRLCVLSHRTHADRIAEACEVIAHAAARAEVGH